jgi:beta-glucosidase
MQTVNQSINQSINQSSMPSIASDAEEQELQEIMSRMSLADKIGQMSQIELGLLLQDDPQNPGHKIADQEKLIHYFGELGIGSLLNNVPGERWTASQFRQVMVAIQQIAKEHNRPPVIWGLDSVHGANYIHGAIVTPQPINIGATFNETVAKLAGVMASRDTRAAGINWLFSPLLGIALSSSWSRVYETFGEDPKLVSDMGTAMIQGIQEEDIGVPSQAAACAKHFIGYSMPHNGHDRSPSWIPTRHLYQYFVPPWRHALQEAKTVMESYTDFDGVPNVANTQTLYVLLRQQLQYQGVVVTDYQEILNLNTWHHIVNSGDAAAIHALREGSVDMAMIPWDADGFRNAIESGINEATVSMERIDQSTKRVLRLKQELGMMDEELTMDNPNIEKIGSETDRKVALDMAYQSIVMVENKNNVLPLAGTIKVHVTGPTSNSLRYQSGGWTWQWQGVDTDDEWFTYGSTVLDAATAMSTWNVTSSCGVDVLGMNCTDEINDSGNLGSTAIAWGAGEEVASIDHAVNLAMQSDYVIACIGEENYAEKPGDINSLALPRGQYDLVQALGKTTAKIIVVYFGGRPRLLDPIVNHAEAILLGFLPGPDAGQAVVDIIGGKVNPSGRLPLTYPKHEDEGGVPYFHAVSDQCTRGDGTLPHWENIPCEVQWPFGHGLSYTTIEYSELTLSDSKIHYTAVGQHSGNGADSGDQGITVTVTVRNTGLVDADETVMFFTFDESRLTTPEYKRLRAYKKVHLKAGESTVVNIVLSMNDPDMRYIGPHDDTHYIVQNGLIFRVGVGSEVDCRSDPDWKDMCSGPVAVVSDDYIGACEAACDIWRTSGCGEALHLDPTTCWTSCSEAETGMASVAMGIEGW